MFPSLIQSRRGVSVHIYKYLLWMDFQSYIYEHPSSFSRWEEESSKRNKPKDEAETEKPIPEKTPSAAPLEANRENIYSNLDSLIGGSLTLGIRASLPKMPSFRRKKIPSPVPEDDDDSRKLSDNEEIVRDSDAEDLNISKPFSR